jgi:phospholipid/cholesterol/gamma-HCH transport system substrate-binding protein
MAHRQLQRSVRRILLLAMVMVAAVVSAVYILSQERLQSPFASPYTVHAAFEGVAGVAPGLGEPVNVAGVQVGQISGAELKDGQGVLELKIDPDKLPHVYADARVVLLPASPLKDMQVNLAPGGRPAAVLPDGGTIPIGRTTTPIDSDDLLAALDTDTRSWLVSLLSGLDRGTAGRGRDLNALFRAIGPTMQQVRQVGDVLAARRGEVARLVHNLSLLSRAAGAKDRDIATVVEAGNAMLGALADQDVALRSSVAQLPGTLHALRGTLGHTTRLADVLAPTLDALLPTARRLEPTLRAGRPLFEGGGLLPVGRVKPFVDAILPIGRYLPDTNQALRRATGPQIKAFKVIQAFTNELDYDPPGPKRSFLYWLAWFAHNANSVVSTEDANGAVLRGLVLISCTSLTAQPALATAIASTLGAKGPCA